MSLTDPRAIRADGARAPVPGGGARPPPRHGLLAVACVVLAAPAAMAGPESAPAPATPVPQGVWLLEGKAAVEIFDCRGRMCGRILWLRIPRDPQGALVLDKKNPDPALRRRPLCGLTVIGDLRPSGPGRWKGGWLYNPDEGVTYKVTARLVSDDVIAARAYRLLPLLGKTLTLARVAHEQSEGWC